MVEEKVKLGTPQDCVAKNAFYQDDGVCGISEGLKPVDCIYIDTKRTEERKFHDHDVGGLVLMLCCGCDYKKKE